MHIECRSSPERCSGALAVRVGAVSASLQVVKAMSVEDISTPLLEDEAHSRAVFLFGCVDTLYTRSNLAARIESSSYRSGGLGSEISDLRV